MKILISTLTVLLNIKQLTFFVSKRFHLLLVAVCMFFTLAQTLKAQDAFMGYDYVSATYPLIWTTEQTTFNVGTSKEIIYTMSGGALYTATTAGTSNINGYQLNANASYIEVQLTDNSTSSSFINFAFTGSTNNNTNAGDAGIVFSDQNPFSETSVISATAITFPAATGSWIVLNPTIPDGAKSMRIYRRIFYNSTTSTSSTNAGDGFIQYGTGTTIRLASLAVTLSTSGTPPTVTTTEITDIMQTTASSGGNVTDEGTASVTVRGVCWSTSENPTIADSKTEDGSGTGTFISSITGLTAGTTYYVRAYATNTAGTSYGDQETFNTLEGVADIVLSSNNPAFPNGNIIAGVLKNPVYKFNLNVTIANTQLNQVDFATSGTYTSSDISKIQLWFNTADNFLNAVKIGNDITTGLGGISNHSFESLTQNINAGETGYLWFTVDVSENATGGNTLSIDAVNTEGLTFSSGNKSGTAFAGGISTIIQPGNPNVYFRTKSSGDWNAITTWETSPDSADWEDATLTPSNLSKYIHIRENHTVTVTETVSVDEVIVDEGATVIVNGTPVVFSIIESEAVIGMLVNGLLKSTGIANASPGPHTIDAEGDLVFGSTGVYEHDQNSGAIPIAVWNEGSTMKLTGVTSQAPGNRNQNYHHLVFDTPGLSSNLNMNYNSGTYTISGNVTIANTGATTRWQLCAPPGDSSVTINILGDVIHLSGNFSTHGTGSGNTTIVINHYGDILATNGNFSVARGSQGGTGTTSWFMHNGSISLSNLETQNSNAAGARFIFTGTSPQNLTISTITYGGGGLPIRVDDGATLHLGSNVVGGNGVFIVNDFGGINTAMPNGFDDNLLTTGTITLSEAGNYGYNGVAAQVTGTLLPENVNTLIINNPEGVTLSESVSANTLNLAEGILNTSSSALLTVTGWLENSIIGGNETAYVNGPLALTLPSSLETGSVYNFPVGKGSYKPLALVDPVTTIDGSVVIQSEVFDDNSGGIPGIGFTSLNTNRYWSAEITSGADNFTSTKIRLTENGLTETMGIGKSSTLDGTYDLISSTEPSGGSITSDDITELSFFVIGDNQSSSTFQLTVSIENGWNMVSIPGLHPVNQEVDTWWSGRDGTANVFGFITGYDPVTEVVPGKGYWMKHLGAETYSTGDEWPTEGMTFVPHDPIPANAGWNLIGGYEEEVLTSAITTDPGEITATIYGYSGGYTEPTSMVPGKAYWIKVSEDGVIIIPSTESVGTPKIAGTDNKQDWGRIIITDYEGRKYTLYAVEGNVNLNAYELPPPPPAGMFDVRYETGRFAENFNSGVQQINMSGMVYPVTVKAENINIRLQDVTGKIINEELIDGEEITINQNNIDKLNVSLNIIPDKFSLEQNYPNPFNPSTIIEFSIPADIKNVTLSVYNVLGEKVAELISGSFEPGYYKYEWNAANLASGLYIYELRTEKSVAVKKMMLLK